VARKCANCCSVIPCTQLTPEQLLEVGLLKQIRHAQSGLEPSAAVSTERENRIAAAPKSVVATPISTDGFTSTPPPFPPARPGRARAE